MKAVIIGIRYIGTDSELRGPENDAFSFMNLLTKNTKIDPNNILLMTDNTPIKPTRDNIIKSFKWLLSASPASNFQNPQGISTGPFYFFYSGHGSQRRSTDPYEPDSLDETLCPLDYKTSGMITDDTIRKDLAVKVPSGSSLFALIDACHSATSFDLRWLVQPVDGKTVDIIMEKYLPTDGNVVVLAGSKDNEKSIDLSVNGKHQGAITYAFCKVMMDNNFSVDYKTLLLQVNDVVNNTLGQKKQHPCLSFGRDVNNNVFTLTQF